MRIKDLLYTVVTASIQFGPPVFVAPWTSVGSMRCDRKVTCTYWVDWVAKGVADRRLCAVDLEARVCVRITTGR